jgi:hypothetical protein
VLKIHTSDGQTHRVDLANSEEAQKWLTRLAREDFQATINGVSLVERHPVRVKCTGCGMSSCRTIGVQYSIPRPESFRKVFFDVEAVEPNGRIKGGERVIVFADGVRLVMMAHASQPATRVSLTHVGKQKFNPKRSGHVIEESNA